RLELERAVLVARLDLVEIGHPDDLDVTAGRDRLDPVLGLAAAEGPQLGSEPDEELGHLAARPAGAPHVARLVQHDREQQSEHEQQRAYDTHARLPAFACLSISLPRPYPVEGTDAQGPPESSCG